MPLDPKWWSITGPFKDNVVGGITAADLRTFAHEIALYGTTGSWFKTNFAPVGLTLDDWNDTNLIRTLWLKQVVPDFEHSVDWEAATSLGQDSFQLTSPGDVTAQISFEPAVVRVTNATSGTTMTPVVSITADAVAAPSDADTFEIGDTLTITSVGQDLDIGGWAAILMSSSDRNLRFGLKFDPPATKAIDGGYSTAFAVDPTGAGVSVVTRSLAPSA